MDWIYHFTHRDNFYNMLAKGGLCCDADLDQSAYKNIGNQSIKARRFRRQVTTAPFGVVADYVPFYFSPRSPMLYVIHRGNVPSVNYGQDQVVYLCCNVNDIFGNYQCCFTDRNAAVDIALFYSDRSKMKDVIDWELMRSIMWNNTPDDTDRMERRMAEFLIHKFAPIQLIREIGVYDQMNYKYINACLQSCRASIPIKIKREWYF